MVRHHPFLQSKREMCSSALSFRSIQVWSPLPCTQAFKACPVCGLIENMAHCFLGCHRLAPRPSWNYPTDNCATLVSSFGCFMLIDNALLALLYIAIRSSSSLGISSFPYSLLSCLEVAMCGKGISENDNEVEIRPLPSERDRGTGFPPGAVLYLDGGRCHAAPLYTSSAGSSEDSLCLYGVLGAYIRCDLSPT